VVSSWSLSLPDKIRTFDYTTISDVILHIRYTAREAGDPLGAQATAELTRMLDAQGKSGQTLLFCLRYDFPTQWSAFINGAGDFQFVLEKQYFPYIAQGAKKLTIDNIALYAANGDKVASITLNNLVAAANASLALPAANATLNLPADANVLIRAQQQQVFLALQYHFGQQ
jgi:hypothetical protein